MKTAEFVEKEKSTPVIPPFHVKECLIGVDFNVSIEALLHYFNFFAKAVPVESVHFLHAVPLPDLFNLYEEQNDLQLNDRTARNDIVEKLRLQANHAVPNIDPSKFRIEVREGNPLEKLLETAGEIESDLVVIGHNVTQTHHGILTKNFARQIKGNALVVPSKARSSLKKILVPVDFSKNSVDALHTAIAINRQQPKPVTIGILHTYNLPANFSAYRFNESKVMEMLEEDREGAIQDFINEHVPEADRKYVEPILIKHNHYSIGHHIAAFADSHKFDLIVMGAKGHSKVELSFIGSVTEKVLALTKKVPVLVVRKSPF